MLFGKYRVKDITTGEYVFYVDTISLRLTDSLNRAMVFSKKHAKAVVSQLQARKEFVQFKMEEV